MKASIVVAAGVVVLGFVGYFVTQPMRTKTSRPIAAPATDSVVISVKGISCMACASKIRRTLRAVPGVAEVEVNLEAGSAKVKFDRSKTAPDALASAINGLGYEAGSPSGASR